jgi:hypothetical protein
MTDMKRCEDNKSDYFDSKTEDDASNGPLLFITSPRKFLEQAVVGAVVQRNIDGIWFLAEVASVDYKKEELSVRYLDDSNVEEGISFLDVRLILDKNFLDVPVVSDKKGTLTKPLAGLLDDDAEIRMSHQPKVMIHNDTEEGEAIILNGAENKLAAGGGLRALRYLRKPSDAKETK